MSPTPSGSPHLMGPPPMWPHERYRDKIYPHPKMLPAYHQRQVMADLLRRAGHVSNRVSGYDVHPRDMTYADAREVIKLSPRAILISAGLTPAYQSARAGDCVCFRAAFGAGVCASAVGSVTMCTGANGSCSRARAKSCASMHSLG